MSWQKIITKVFGTLLVLVTTYGFVWAPFHDESIPVLIAGGLVAAAVLFGCVSLIAVWKPSLLPGWNPAKHSEKD